MSLKTDLYTYLSTHASITPLVSTRIYPGLAPTSAARPYIVFDIDSSQGEHYMGGDSGMAQVYFGFTVWADTALSVDTIANTLRTVLDAYRGNLGGTSDVRRITYMSDTDSIETPDDGGQTATFARSQSYRAWVKR